MKVKYEYEEFILKWHWIVQKKKNLDTDSTVQL